MTLERFISIRYGVGMHSSQENQLATIRRVTGKSELGDLTKDDVKDLAADAREQERVHTAVAEWFGGIEEADDDESGLAKLDEAMANNGFAVQATAPTPLAEVLVHVP